MLRQLADILADTSYSALLIAGDVYDRSIPSPDAVSLYSGFLGQLKFTRPDLEILILPGNHDSAARLGFGKELFSALGIHFVTDPNDAVKPVIVKSVASGGANSGVQESCAFFLLPFLHPGSLTAQFTNTDTVDGDQSALPGVSAEEAPPIRSQARLAAEAAARLAQARLAISQNAAQEAGADYAVLGAHLFAGGGIGSESERIFLGSAEQVDISPFAGFDYLALGHLHRRQQAGERAWYSGSPLAYSFGEAKYEKAFLSVELHGGSDTVVIPVPVQPKRKLMSLSGSFRFFNEESVKDPTVIEAENAYLEISLTGADLTANPLPLLRQRFPFLLAIRQDEAFAALRAANGLAGEATEVDSVNAGRRTLADDFANFLADIYGSGFADGEKAALFRELLAEAEHGEDATL
jgi:exonuclease SbcD